MAGCRIAHFLRRALLAFGVAAAISQTAQAQYSEPAPYHPLNQFSPPGMAGQWAGAIGRATPLYMQPVEVRLPSDGQVTFYSGSAEHAAVAAPAAAGFGVGFVYRVRISDMPEFPAVDLYPTVELVDRLYPPAGSVDKFPIPIEFTEEEIAFALNGQLVTKVVYVEQPQIAATVAQDELEPVVSISPEQNPIAEAERRGRAVAIVRLGGRVPSVQGADPAFFGPPAPLAFPRPEAAQDVVPATYQQ